MPEANPGSPDFHAHYSQGSHLITSSLTMPPNDSRAQAGQGSPRDLGLESLPPPGMHGYTMV